MSEIKDSKLLNMFDQGHTADEPSSQPLIVAYNRYVCMNNPKKSSLRGNLAEKRQKVGVRKSHFVFGSFELANSSFESPFSA